MRAANSGIHLNDADAAVVKGMLARGDRQHDIAAWFGVNGGRIAEVSTGATFGDVAMKTDNLPPPGPYPTTRAVQQVKAQLIEARTSIAKVLAEVDEMLKGLG